MEFPENPFWDFSVEVHQKSGVHEACLSLQRDYTLDVNLLFFCCWLDMREVDNCMNRNFGRLLRQ